MPENKPFVINDRRKFTAEGEPRPDAPQALSSDSTEAPPAGREPSASLAADQPSVETSAVTSASEPRTGSEGTGSNEAGSDEAGSDEAMPPLPTAEEIAQVTRAYDATVDRLDTAMRASNPGGDRLPPMTFDRLVQSLYMQALLQLGGAAEPGQAPQVDIIGGRQTIDMLAVIADKVNGNLGDNEDKLLQSALFELRMGFLEVTQALARQAAARQPGARQPGTGPGGLNTMPGFNGPSIVR